MFRELLAAWRGADPLKEMYQDLIRMLEAGEWMFGKCWDSALQGSVQPDVKDAVYKRDIEVNRAERAIRRRIVEHLVLAPGQDIPACLILMSVVKDAERIGDYCKNTLEAAEMEAEPVTSCEFFDSFKMIYDETGNLFGKTRRALAEADVTLGHEVIDEERNVVALCDTLVERLASSELPARKAVPWALLARYLKRVSAHLGNLASSLVMPLHKLDYYDEKFLPGAGDENGSS
jgi:phosphate uptake regulator